VPLPILDLSDSLDPKQAAELFCKREASAELDLVCGPLVKFVLIRLRADEHWLLHVAHHINCDGASWDLYVEELGLLYEAKLRGDAPPLPEFTSPQYGDYATWQRRLLSRAWPAYQTSVEWWRKYLSGASSTLELPFRRVHPQLEVNPSEGQFYWGIEPEISRGLNVVASAERATPYMVRLAAFAAILADVSGQPDVVFGGYISGRNRPELQRMLGDFSNLVTLRFQYKPQLSFFEWLSKVRDTMLAVQKHSLIPYEKLCDELREIFQTPPQITALFHMTQRYIPNKLANLEFTLLRRCEPVMPWGITVTHDGNDEVQECRVTFDANIHDPAGVRLFVDRYTRLLDAISHHPNCSLAQLMTMSQTGGRLDGLIGPSQQCPGW
ncbi:MAG TPA: condensation domain-containing protein, partial [Nitrospira sp.]|nr:condensation domain-containing protein [Nitrospira sp.]